MSTQLTPEQIQLWSSVLVELEEVGGRYYCSIRGLARLLGVSVSTFTDGRVRKGRPRGLLWRLMLCSEEELPDSLKGLAGYCYLGEDGAARLLPQEVIEGIIRYYASDALVINERAVGLLGVIEVLWGGMKSGAPVDSNRRPF